MTIIPSSKLPDVSEVFQAGDWTGHRCFIVGGGPSLRGFDFSSLEGEKVIAINTAFRHALDDWIVFCMDRRVFAWHQDNPKLSDHPVKIWHKAQGDAWNLPFPVYTVTRRKGGEWSDTLEEIPTGGNTGLGALNFACILNADPIYLLGYDMGGYQSQTERQEHWHEGHPVTQGYNKYNGFRRTFEYYRKQDVFEGRNIYTVGLESKLESFPVIPLPAEGGCLSLGAGTSTTLDPGIPAPSLTEVER